MPPEVPHAPFLIHTTTPPFATNSRGKFHSLLGAGLGLVLSTSLPRQAWRSTCGQRRGGKHEDFGSRIPYWKYIGREHYKLYLRVWLEFKPAFLEGERTPNQRAFIGCWCRLYSKTKWFYHPNKTHFHVRIGVWKCSVHGHTPLEPRKPFWSLKRNICEYKNIHTYI